MSLNGVDRISDSVKNKKKKQQCLFGCEVTSLIIVFAYKSTNNAKIKSI